ncbi:hypothetical protein [Ferrimonas sp. SCSIO 43195]|uniref:hypothetical protein n=1 Tax=Ferrimonas sp. SCSIO 43195 TaxID=2822844 RepID=UPI0020762439|nr:hypothetical protein [Ferrimonas sp. SCSIO 43195]USD37541.1 Crp/Fnr family transcriptional regulator [Ferrimonas sp. SCSIO 43195]
MRTGASTLPHSSPWIPPEAPAFLRMAFYEKSALITVKKGDSVVHRNALHQHPYQNCLILVQRGLLGRRKCTNDINKQLFTTLLLPNRIYGYSGFLRYSEAEDTLVALRESQIMVLPITHLKQKLANNCDSRLKQEVITYFLSCLEAEQKSLFVIATNDTQDRLSKLFKALIHSTLGKDHGDKYEVPIRLTNEEVRKLIYTTKKTINTILPYWKREGLYCQNEHSTLISKSII